MNETIGTLLDIKQTGPAIIEKDMFHQEIYRPGTAISDGSNLCTAVGGDQNKEFRGNASFMREQGPRGGIRIYCCSIFHIDQKPKSHKYLL